MLHPHLTLMVIPFCFRRDTVTPSPDSDFPPRLMHPQPQDGLSALTIASVAPTNFASRSTSAAPFRKLLVTSRPPLSSTIAFPKRTSAPSPPCISAGSLGVGKPPSCSGQSGNARCVSTREITSWSGELSPSYLQATPARHALTITTSESPSLSQNGSISGSLRLLVGASAF